LCARCPCVCSVLCHSEHTRDSLTYILPCPESGDALFVEAMERFNANIPYSGLTYSVTQEVVFPNMFAICTEFKAGRIT